MSRVQEIGNGLLIGVALSMSIETGLDARVTRLEIIERQPAAEGRESAPRDHSRF